MGHARSCIDVIELSESFKIAGLIGKSEEGGNILGYPILGTDDNLSDLRKNTNLL